MEDECRMVFVLCRHVGEISKIKQTPTLSCLSHDLHAVQSISVVSSKLHSRFHLSNGRASSSYFSFFFLFFTAYSYSSAISPYFSYFLAILHLTCILCISFHGFLFNFFFLSEAHQLSLKKFPASLPLALFYTHTII